MKHRELWYSKSTYILKEHPTLPLLSYLRHPHHGSCLRDLPNAFPDPRSLTVLNDTKNDGSFGEGMGRVPFGYVTPSGWVYLDPEATKPCFPHHMFYQYLWATKHTWGNKMQWNNGIQWQQHSSATLLLTNKTSQLLQTFSQTTAKPSVSEQQ